MDEIFEILKSIPTMQGYSWEELKDKLTKDEYWQMIGMAWAYYSIKNYTPMFYDSILEKIKEEITEETVEEIKTHLMLEMASVLTSFGDNHPEEEGEANE